MLTVFLFPFVWMSGVTFLIDETTIHVKGRQADKKTGCAIFQKRYTYQIFMCNDPLQKKCFAKRMLPLHLKVMFFFDTVEGKHHQRAMDNIYISGTFFKAAYNYEKITDSWCYTERSERHSAIRYTRIIGVK